MNGRMVGVPSDTRGDGSEPKMTKFTPTEPFKVELLLVRWDTPGLSPRCYKASGVGLATFRVCWSGFDAKKERSLDFLCFLVALCQSVSKKRAIVGFSLSFLGGSVSVCEVSEGTPHCVF